jgi:hypothetical protein
MPNDYNIFPTSYSFPNNFQMDVKNEFQPVLMYYKSSTLLLRNPNLCHDYRKKEKL